MIVPSPRKCVACAGKGRVVTREGRNEYELDDYGPCGECTGTGVYQPRARVVYIAGPFRARTSWEVEQRVRKAEEMSVLLWQAGVINLCPHTMGRFTNGSFDENILAGMLELASRCDGIVMLPNWFNSVGSQAEHALMEKLDKKIFYSPVNLATVIEWARQSAP